MASITRRGDTWLVRITRKGYPQINKSFATKRDAEAFASVTEGEIARGSYRRDAGDKVTFRRLVERYRDEVTPTKRGATKESSHIAALLRVDSAANKMLDKMAGDLQPSDVAAWRDARLKQVAPGTLKREWVIVAHVVEVARVEWGFTGLVSPFGAVRKPEVRDARDRRVSPEEVDAIVAATDSPELGALVRLAVETAARRGELLSLQWRDIDVKRRTARLAGSSTKNGHGRVLPLSPAALAILQGLPRRLDGGAVFSLRPNSVTQAFNRAVQRGCVRYRKDCAARGVAVDERFLVGVRFHDLRHEACSRLAELGLQATELASISGHRTLSLLARYVHHQPERIAAKLAERG